jgi:hypothetical protein
MRVTEVCADPAPQQSEKQMGGLEMSWNTEGGRLVCRWVDSQRRFERTQLLAGGKSSNLSRSLGLGARKGPLVVWRVEGGIHAPI